MIRKFTSVICILAVIATAFVCNLPTENNTVTAVDTISDLEQKQAELQKKSEEYQKKLEKTNNEIKKTKEYQETLVNKINTVNEEIVVSQQKVDQLTVQINSKTKKIKKLNQDIENQTDTLRGRIRTIYMSGDVSSLEIILGAKDFSDFLDKVQLVKSVSDYDEKLIAEIEDDMTTVKSEKKALESDKEKQMQEQENLEDKRDEIQTLVDENQKVLDTLYTRNKAQEEAIRKNNGELNGLDDQITAYYEEQERIRAEEEKRRKEQEQQQQQNNSDNNSSYSESTTDNSIADTPIITPITGSGFAWPVPGHQGLSSTYGEDRGSYGHGAIDISDGGIMGATVVAADSGTVVVAENYCTHNYAKGGSCGCGGGYGNWVWIDHGNGKATIYGHLTQAVVSPGATVSKGQVIGYVGSTGWSSGPHLHFECRYNGVKYDPMSEY